jgi:hypothetical protein
MQLGIDSQIPDGLLAANALLAENSRQGVPTSTHTLHRGFEFAISSTYKGFQFRCSESASDPVVAPSKGIKARAQCAAANASSFASLLGINNSNWLGQTLLGNDISTISNIVFGPGQANAIGQAAVSNPTPANVIVQLASAIGSTQSTQLQLVQTAAQDAFGNPQFYARALSLAETAGGKALSEAFSGFGVAKLGFDVAAYAYAYTMCGN